jgi:hypothetical protein
MQGKLPAPGGGKESGRRHRGKGTLSKFLGSAGETGHEISDQGLAFSCLG